MYGIKNLRPIWGLVAAAALACAACSNPAGGSSDSTTTTPTTPTTPTAPSAALSISGAGTNLRSGQVLTASLTSTYTETLTLTWYVDSASVGAGASYTIPDSLADGAHSVDIVATTRAGAQAAKATASISTANAFVTVWKTNNSGVSSSTQIKLPLESTGTYNFTADWGDGTADTITAYNDAAATHRYSAAGTYTVRFTGTLHGFSFGGSTSDSAKILEIKQWGNMRLGNSGYYFNDCSNLSISATDTLDLTGTTSLAYAFANCHKITIVPSMNSWDTSGVTNMGSMFSAAILFNQDLGNWNTTNVMNMSNMFLCAYAFNQPIGNWNTANVTNMSSMFWEAAAFNQPLGNWNVTAVTGMNRMLSDTPLSTANYDATLNGWATQTVKSGVALSASAKYSSAGSAARTTLVSKGWTISDGGLAP